MVADSLEPFVCSVLVTCSSIFDFCLVYRFLGDVICVLFWCSFPVILRRVGESENGRVVGEAYIHGVMEGEASVGWKVEKANLESLSWHKALPCSRCVSEESQ